MTPEFKQSLEEAAAAFLKNAQRVTKVPNTEPTFIAGAEWAAPIVEARTVEKICEWLRSDKVEQYGPVDAWAYVSGKDWADEIQRRFGKGFRDGRSK